ncbi:CIB1-like protein [Mya arenaria]|uniref:CIB1-like protein n=1 Tax=Mya arenaria TaxID=6604 RepID=A0ABY7FQR3_MYAAR|nr:CIB1-like protein [Mya arenaria]
MGHLQRPMLNSYCELTYFTKKEILHVYKRFSLLNPDAVSKDKNAKLGRDEILDLPELKVNPFKDRICQVFSSSKDGDMTFEDFLDMMSVFSDNAPKNFDEDDMISSKDLKEIFEEADLDDDDSLSFAEFEHVISKAPDFVNSFRIRL